MLELVEFGVVDEEIEHAIDRRPGEFVVALGTVHQPDENGPVADNEGRDAEDGVIVHCGLVLTTEHVERPAGVELGEDGVVVDASRREG